MQCIWSIYTAIVQLRPIRYAVHHVHFCNALYSTAIVQHFPTLCSASSPILCCVIQYSLIKSNFFLRYAVHLVHLCTALYRTAIVHIRPTLCSASSPFLHCVIQYSYSTALSYVMQCIQSISALCYTVQLWSNLVPCYAVHLVHFCAVLYCTVYNTVIVQLGPRICSASSPFLRCVIQYCTVQLQYSPTSSHVIQCIQSICALCYTVQLVRLCAAP